MVNMKSTQSQNGTSSDLDTGFLIRRDQAAIETASTSSTLLTNSFIAATAAIMMWQPEAKATLAGWILLVAFVNLLRYVSILVGIRLRLVERRPDRMLMILAAGAFVSGISWAILPVLANFDGFLFNPTMSCVISGVTAGKAVLSPIYRHAVWPFILSVLASYICCLLIQNNFVSYVLAIDFVIFTVILFRAAVKSEKAFFRLSRMKYEAMDLAVSLRQANDAAFAANKRLEFLANHDSLTGLANRSAFNVALRAAMDRARLNHEDVALLLIDLDRFKSINDTHGHSAGDRVLVEAAQRLRLAVEASDVVARLGGDEFAIILMGPRIQIVAEAAARAAVDFLREPIEVGDRLVKVGGSVGVSFYPQDGTSVEELQICADVALYAAKADGRGRVRIFDAKLRAETEARRIYELDLGKALASGAIEVWFQPQVRLSDRQLCGLEALVRWKHAEHGWVPPPEIVSAAAATRLSEALTSRVIDASCQMIRALDDVGRSDVNVSFNASPRELGQYSLPDVLAAAIADHGVLPTRLEVEITEEAMFQDDFGASVLRRIAALGVNIAIDDFGVGYSSFGVLKQQAFNCIKIDRVFIDGLTSGEDGRALVQAILGVARALGVKAIAEGVETAEQAAVLHHLGCPEVQGYYFGRPMPAAALMQWIVAQDQSQPQRELPLFQTSQPTRILSFG